MSKSRFEWETIGNIDQAQDEVARAEQQNTSTEQLRAQDEAQRIEAQYPNAHTSDLEPEPLENWSEYYEERSEEIEASNLSDIDKAQAYADLEQQGIDAGVQQGESISNDVSVDGGEQGQEL